MTDATTVPAGYVDSLVTQAAEPIALDFLPDGRLIWAERYGRIAYLNTTGPTTILDITAKVYIGSEGGLLGLAVDPDFPSRPFVYTHYTAGPAPAKARISRFTFSDTGSNLLLDPASEVIGFGDMPKPQVAHFAGAVRFDPQKRLVTSFGEGYVGGCGSQNATEEAGKLLRMRVDTWDDPGNQSRLVPADNPFIAHPNMTRKLTLMEGLRNPFRFDVDAVTGEFYIGDVGNEWEEVNVGRGGENMGWPYFESSIPYELVPCPGHTSIPANTTTPVYVYQREQGWPGAAVMGMMLYRGLDWPNNSFPPAMDGTFFFSDFAHGSMRVIKKNQSTGQWDLVPGVGPTYWGTGFQHVTDMTVGPDGSAYYVRMWLPSEIRRISYGSSSPLQAGISANRTSGPAPLSVDFTSMVSGGSPPYSYSWSFGDGNASSSENVTHTYAAPGTYIANMTVRDLRGSRSDSNSITIIAKGLGATISAAPTRGKAPLNVSFSSLVSGGSPPYSYSWAFGDGGTSSAADPFHTYAAPGNYSANLTAHDSSGTGTVSNSVAISVTGGGGHLQVSVSADPAVGPAPLPVSFTSAPSGGAPPYSFAWTFGDGGTATAKDPSHTYTVAGTYSAVLSVTDSDGASANSGPTTITVSGGGVPLTVSMTAVPASGPAPLTVEFAGTPVGGTPPYAYSWDFGDGGAADGRGPSHTYGTAGSYVAGLEVEDSAGAIAMAGPVIISVDAPVDDRPPVIAHAPPVRVDERTAPVIRATVTDDFEVSSVALLYRQVGQPVFKSLVMSAASGDQYQATIPSEEVSPEWLEYYIEASDPSSNIATSPDSAPESLHTVKVTPALRRGVLGPGSAMNLVLFGLVAAIAVIVTAVTVRKPRGRESSTPAARKAFPHPRPAGKGDVTSEESSGKR